MKVRIFAPPADRFDAATRFDWVLIDARRAPLRENATPLTDVPRADDVELVLPASRVLFARLKLPRVNAATIRELLPFAVEDRLLGDPANIHAVAGRRDANGETTVAIVDREWLGSLLAALRHAGLRPSHAWSESALLEAQPGEWSIVWGPERGVLVDDRGVSAAFDRAARDLPLAIRLALDEAAARGDRPSRLHVHTESGESPPDLERWRTDAGLDFAPGVPWEGLRTKEPSPDAIDLLQGDFAPQASGIAAARIPRAAAVLVAIIALAQILFVGLDAWRLDRERGSLEAKREAIFRSAFPEAKTVVDPDLQMSRNLADLKRTRGLAGGDDFLVQLTRAAREGTARSVVYANGRLETKR